jgi:metal-responsive CopG/Arc/MetJ family transcriptional regulator
MMFGNIKNQTMASSKIAITIPEDVLADVDAAARAGGESRSGFISRILRAALRARRDAGITQRLNELFADESVVLEQDRIARDMDAAGTDWSDEDWE